MFDTYEPSEKITLNSFTFIPTNYECWVEGEMVAAGETILPLIAKVTSVMTI